jgi:uncharacterized protein YukE
MAANSLTMTQFKVDLKQLENATNVVSAQSDIIKENCERIADEMRGASSAWVSPSGQTFEELIPLCIKQMGALTDLLTEMVKRMRASYQTYLTMEQTNTRNLQ